MKGLLSSYRDREVRASNPYQPWGNWVPPTNGQLAFGGAGGPVTETGALSIAAVYTANSILADAIATLPLRQYRTTTMGMRKEMAPSALVQNPFVEMSQLDWITQMQFSLGLRGNAYGIIIERDAKGFARQVMPVHPDRVSIRRDSQAGRLQYQMNGDILDLDDVYHVRGYSMPGSPVGLSPIEVLRTPFSNAMSADNFYGAFFGNSAQPGGLLRVPGDLDDDQARQLAQQWMASHQGVGSAHLPAVLSGGVEWVPLTVTPQDAQFLQGRQYSEQQILSGIYRIPPHFYGSVDRSPQATGIEEVERSFITNALMGWLRRHEIAVSSLLPIGQEARFDLSERLRPDLLTRAQVAQVYRNIGVITPAEVRANEGMDDLPPEFEDWANNPMAPLNSAQNGAYVQPGDETPVQKAPSVNPNPNAH